MSNKQNYIFGYGSLIERTSRTRTTPDALDVYPIIVQGLARGWWQHGKQPGLKCCFLGMCREDATAQCNGVLYAVSEEELTATDKREWGYERLRITPEQITMLCGREDIRANADIWGYVVPTPDLKRAPTPDVPIVQSYVDICMNGCFEIEEEFPAAKAANFAEMFIQTTGDWNRYWINDRVQPRRPHAFVPRAYEIDNLLKTRMPDLFDQIQLEPAKW